LTPIPDLLISGEAVYGGEKRVATLRQVGLDLGEISQAARVWIRTPLLIQTSHTHLFGQTLIAGLLGLIFLFSSVREWLKATIVALPFVGTILDIGGMWLTRFAHPSLHCWCCSAVVSSPSATS
jgi:hypothetical protein